MGEVITIGLDIAKSVFQMHRVDDGGAVVIRKRVSRANMLEFFAGLPRCLIGIEACPAAHHRARELQAIGHSVKLMPPNYVKTYLKRGKLSELGVVSAKGRNGTRLPHQQIP
jgi:transposase